MNLRLTTYVNAVVFYLVMILCSVAVGCARQERPSQFEASNITISENAININTASVAELETLPGIGETLAQRIVDFREKNGPFRRAENLLLVPGISEKKFRQIRARIKTN